MTRTVEQQSTGKQRQERMGKTRRWFAKKNKMMAQCREVYFKRYGEKLVEDHNTWWRITTHGGGS